MGRRRLALVALSAVVVIFGGWVLARTHSSDPAPTTASGVSEPTCSMATLPPEVVDTVRRIHAGGPFPFPRSDGAVFVNREGHLPKQRRGVLPRVHRDHLACSRPVGEAHRHWRSTIDRSDPILLHRRPLRLVLSGH